MAPLDRRRFVTAGAGALAAAAFGTRARRAHAQSGGTTPFLLVVYASGGWDTALVFDNKLGNRAVATDSGAAAATGGGKLPYVDNASRPAVKAFFDTFGAQTAVVNGLSVGSLDHRTATRLMLGTTPDGQDEPVDWGTYYAANQNPSLALPHVVIDAPFMSGQYESVATRLTTATIAEYLTPFTSADTLGGAGEQALLAYRSAAFTGIDQPANTNSLDAEKLRSLAYGEQQEALITTALTKAKQTIGADSTDPAFVYNGKIAVELFAQGSSQAVTLQAGADGLFDTTTANFSLQSQAYQTLFSGLSTILQYATTRSVAANLTLVVLSELGRNPHLNALGGKGPWPYTSAMVWGPFINGGTVAGLTDSALRGLPIDPIFGGQTGPNAVQIEVSNLFSALYLHTGVPQAPMVTNAQPLSLIIKGGS